MKKIIYTALALILFSACETTAPMNLQLVADKTEAEASGQDYVTFKLLDADGVDVLADRNSLQHVNIVSEDGFRVPRMSNKVSFIANGTYKFTAKYNGQESDNSVEIVAKNRGKYEKYHKNVALYKATGTWCAYCPAMTTAIEAMNDDAKSHSVEMCWHGSSTSSDDPWAIPEANYNDCGNALVYYFSNLSGKSLGFPTVILDLETIVTEKSASALENGIWNLRAEYPATSGIKLSSKYDSAAGKIEIVAELTSSTGGEYDMGFAVLLNNQTYQGTAPDGKYSRIVRASSSNFVMHGTLKNLAKDTPSEFKYTFNAGEGIDKDNMVVVAYSLVNNGDRARIDNIVEAKLGESIDYAYNE